MNIMRRVRISTVDVHMRTKQIYKTKPLDSVTYGILTLYVFWYKTW